MPSKIPSKIAIISYHKIGPPAARGGDTWYHIPGEASTEPLRLLTHLGYASIALSTFYHGVDNPAALPPKSALITFDDAYRNNLTVALPIMQPLGIPGVVFVPTQYIGGLNTSDSGNEPDEPHCQWNELLSLER